MTPVQSGVSKGRRGATTPRRPASSGESKELPRPALRRLPGFELEQLGQVFDGHDRAAIGPVERDDESSSRGGLVDDRREDPAGFLHSNAGWLGLRHGRKVYTRAETCQALSDPAEGGATCRAASHPRLQPLGLVIRSDFRLRFPAVGKRSKTVEIEFQLEGSDKTTSTANMAMLGQVLQSWSNLIESVHADGARAPAAEVHKVVAVRIEQGSHHVHARLPASHVPALRLVADSIRSGNMSALPTGSRPYMTECAGQLRKANQVLRIVENKSAGIDGAVLIEAPADAPEARIKGETTMVGRLRAIGGVVPTLHLETRPRAVTITATVEQAREVAKLLYCAIVVDVAAEWSVETSDLAACKLLRWRTGPDSGLIEGVHALAEHHGQVWDAIDDPAEWVRQLRGDDE